MGRYRLRLRRLLNNPPIDTYTSTTHTLAYLTVTAHYLHQLHKDLTISCELFFLGYQMLQTLIFSSNVQSFFFKITDLPPCCYNPSFGLCSFHSNISHYSTIYVMPPTPRFKTFYYARKHCHFIKYLWHLLQKLYLIFIYIKCYNQPIFFIHCATHIFLRPSLPTPTHENPFTLLPLSFAPFACTSIIDNLSCPYKLSKINTLSTYSRNCHVNTSLIYRLQDL